MIREVGGWGIFLATAGILIVTAWLIRRLLGIERGRWVATLVAALFGQAAALGVIQVVTGNFLTASLAWTPAALGFIAVFSVLALAILEAGARPPRPRSRRRRGPIAALVGATQSASRSLQLIVLALRHGLFGSRADEEDGRGSGLGRALAATFEEAGGLFVKLGQAMASQPQLVGPAVAAELGRLQDRASRADPASAMAVVNEELGSIDEVFAEFDVEPAGAASIAQTYFARLHDGREVVVKVQRPGVAKAIERDLDLLERAVRLLERRTTWATRLGLRELVTGFSEATREELDFHIEAANGIAARAALDDRGAVVVPEVLDGYTTRRVLVQERVRGRPVGAAGVMDRVGAQARVALADALLGVVMRQMVTSGRFHADPHPGNVFLTEGGQLALIDFGAVGRLDRLQRSGIIDMFRGLGGEDPMLMRQAALRLGRSTGRVDAEAMDREFARLLAGAIQPDGRLNPSVFGDLLTIFRDFDVTLPSSMAALFRTLMTLAGSLETISPAYDLVDGVRRLGPDVIPLLGRPGTFREVVQQEVLSAAPVLQRLPRDIDDVLRSLERGDLRTRVSLLSEPEDARVAGRLVNRLTTGLVGSSVVVASALLLSAGVGRPVNLITIAGGVGLTFASLLLLRTVVQVLREGD